MGAVLMFLLEHLDLITAIKDALDGGASKADILKGIKASMVAVSDADMHIELDP